jgi:acetate kinase
VELGGVDVVTFSGGIGENSAEVRAGVCAGLAELGIVLDEERNRTVKGEGKISADRAKVAVWVLPADEEIVVARAVAEVLKGGG